MAALAVCNNNPLVGKWEYKDEDKWGGSSTVTFDVRADGTGTATDVYVYGGARDTKTFDFEWETSDSTAYVTSFDEDGDEMIEDDCEWRVTDSGDRLIIDYDGEEYRLNKV